MKHLTRLLLTISINLGVLFASGVWLVAQYQEVSVRGTFGIRQTLASLEGEAWFFECGEIPFS